MRLKDAKILVIDDDHDVLTALRLLLKPLVLEVATEKKPANILSRIQSDNFDVIILDMNFNGLVNTGNEGIFWLNKIKEEAPKVSVILITAYGDIDLAIRSLKQGASDFLVKPWKNDKLIHAVTDLVEARRGKKTVKKNHLATSQMIVGESQVMKEVFVKLQKVAPTDANILILGENGTGKDLVAKAIHENSNRKHKPFVKVDVGALTSTLFESELFGYKKGAFTGAREDRQGRFEAAQGGTLFLDEIGNISLLQQARLLTVLQNRQITPLGSNESTAIDIRLICATNLDLTALVDETKFRKDLIYRINTVDIVVPPLRERGSDISQLAMHFASIYSEKYSKAALRLHPAFLKKLEQHSFPGNVRELQYIMERAVIMTDNDVLQEEDLVFSALENHPPASSSKMLNLDSVEKHTILQVLDKNKGNISQSAKDLGITRAALYRRLQKHDL